jgi:DNA-3-methyladenine glycosylase II
MQVEKQIQYITYGEIEISHLSAQDPALARAISRIGYIARRVEPDLFVALTSSIISQQISTKAAETVLNRLIVKCGLITPTNVKYQSLEDIMQCGMSGRKAKYIWDLAHAVCCFDLDLTAIRLLSDDEVIQTLSKYSGIGPWTAEMMLIFSLERPDVVSFSDLGIRRGMMKLYNLENITRKEFTEYRRKYTPYGTVASLYLWEIVHESA